MNTRQFPASYPPAAVEIIIRSDAARGTPPPEGLDGIHGNTADDLAFALTHYLIARNHAARICPARFVQRWRDPRRQMKPRSAGANFPKGGNRP